MNGNESFIQVRDCTVHVWRGRGSGVPLLFLHGASGAPVWAPYMDLLAQQFDLFLPEHPGFGRSTPGDSIESISDLAFFYLDFLDTLGLPFVHLAGTSMGGWIAAEIAIRNCSRLKSLTLIGPAGLSNPHDPYFDLLMSDVPEVITAAIHDQALARQALSMKPTPEQQLLTMQNWGRVSQLVWEPRAHSRDLAKWLHRITIPTLILWGEYDRICPVSNAAVFQSLIPGSRLQWIRNCGHLPHVEKAQELVGAITAFTREVGE